MFDGRECFLCGRNGCGDPLDKHHIFGGAFRKKSERYGLTVYLCHDRCHENGKYAVHRCAETMDRLHRYGQKKAMEEQGWTVEEFILEFGKNYLDEEELVETGDGGTGKPVPYGAAGENGTGKPVPYGEGFTVLEGKALPW